MKLAGKKITRGSFVSNVLVILGGSAGAQIIMAASSPLLTRLYPPTEFGIFALFFSALSILSTSACGGYEFAVMEPDDDEEATAVAATAIVIACMVSMGLVLFSIFFNSMLSSFPTFKPIHPWTGLLAVGVCVIGWYRTITYWIMRKKNFHAISHSRVIQSLSGVSIQILLGMTRLLPGGLIVGRIIGTTTASLFLLLKEWKKLAGSILSPASIRKQAVKYKKFPLFLSWGRMIDTLSVHITPFLLVSFFPTAIVGAYALANQVIGLPLLMVGNAISQVFFQKASEEWKNRSDIAMIIERIMPKLFLIAFLPLLSAALLAPRITPLIFGERWILTGKYIQIMAPVFLMQFTASPLSTSLIVTGKQNVLAYMQAGLLAASVIPICTGGFFIGEATHTIALLSAGQTLAYTTYMIVIVKSSRAKWTNIWKNLTIRDIFASPTPHP